MDPLVDHVHQGVLMTDADSLQPSGDRLALLCRLSQTFNSTLDLDEVLNRVIDEVIAATRAERGFVMLREDDGRLVFRAARGMDRETIDDPEFQISRSVVERVAYEGQPLLTSNAQSDEWLSGRVSVIALGLLSILCVPLRIKDTILGVIYVDNRLQVGLFSPDDLELLATIAASAAIAIENARLYQVAVEKGRMERELQVARGVQAGLLPRQTPQIPGWEFAAQWQPAREVAGDFYDFISLEGGRLGLVVADVSDKGMPAALFMALCRTTIRASVSQASSPSEGIAHANRLICADAADGMFVTLFYAQLDPQTGEFSYVNAGHNPPLLCRPGSAAEAGETTQLMPTGMVLGVLPDFPFGQSTVNLKPGDFVLLYTDGVTDATGTASQRFGLERLQRVVLEHRYERAVDLVAVLEATIGEFSGPSAPFDDVAILVVKRGGNG
jgi:sigma-B regulation protein RsbU (phosphoserine phosphatase)